MLGGFRLFDCVDDAATVAGLETTFCLGLEEANENEPPNTAASVVLGDTGVSV